MDLFFLSVLVGWLSLFGTFAAFLDSGLNKYQSKVLETNQMRTELSRSDFIANYKQNTFNILIKICLTNRNF